MLSRRTTDEIDLVSVHDPAIDRGQSRLIEYVRTRDIGLLRWLPGQRPTKFRCRPLTQAGRLYCQRGETDHERWLRAFQCCVRSVEGFEVEREGVRTAWLPRLMDIGELGRILQFDCLEDFPAEVLDEIGCACLQLAELSDPFAGRLSLPHGALPPLVAVRQPVSATAAPTPAGAPSSAATGPQTGSDGSGATSSTGTCSATSTSDRAG